MRTLAGIVLTLAFCCSAGCAHKQLEWNTTHQAKTLTDIYEQQVLDNLAMFVYDANSLPSFAYPNEGASNVNDSGNIGSSTSWVPVGFASEMLSLGADRDMRESWVLQPVYDVRRLELMRCAYQHALRCTGICSGGDCCPDCDKIQRTFYLGDPAGNYDRDPYNDHLGYWSSKTGRTTPACLTGVQWLRHGDCTALPHCRSGKVGHYRGTYVWLAEGGQNELSKLTMIMLDYAFSAQPKKPEKRQKDITLYFDRDGKLVGEHSKRAVEFKTTVDYDTEIPLASYNELLEEEVDRLMRELGVDTTPNLQQKLGIAANIDREKAAETRAKFRQGVREAIETGSPSFPKNMFLLDNGFQNEVDEKTGEARKRFITRKTALEAGTLRQIIGTPNPPSPELPPIQSPSTDFSPLRFELYRETLTSPSN